MRLTINNIEIETDYYVKKWTDWALSDRRFTDEEVINNVQKLYAKSNLNKPSVLVFRNYEKFLTFLSENWASVRDSVRASVGASVRASIGAWYWADELSFGDVFYDTNVISKEKAKELDEYKSILETQRMAILTKEIAYVLVSPTIRRNEDGQLSSDQRPAVEWEDNTGIYYLDGVELEKDLWKRIVSGEMSFKEIMAIEISDKRTVALKYNPQALLSENSKLVDKDDRNNELYLIEGQQINSDLGFDKMYFLKMICPTGRIFIEGVPPNEAEKNPSASAMQAFLCGLTEKEYSEMKLES